MLPQEPEKEPSSAALEQLRANLSTCRRATENAAKRAGRDPAGISLIAVTKYVEPPVIRLLHQAGIRDFGESTVQGGDARSQELSDLEGARWHLVGHLQRNKVPRALQVFKSIHSVDSLRLIHELRSQAEKRHLPLPELYLEVNISGEPQKTGLPEAEVRNFLAVLKKDERPSMSGTLAAPIVAGLMGMAPHGESPEESRPCFRRLRELRDALLGEGLLPRAAGLSMGMSGDFTTAVEEGATVLRIGSLLFEGLS